MRRVVNGLARAAVLMRDLLDSRPRVAIGLSLLAATLLLGAFVLHLWIVRDLESRAGIDYRQYSEAIDRWISGGSFYQPWQLAGPYDIPTDIITEIAALPVLYPPSSIPLLFLGRLLGPIFWWGVPITVTIICVWRLRPRPWTWPFLTLCALAGLSVWLVISGNPIMWSTAALALATRWRWVAIGVLLKPSLPIVPFAIVGARDRRWWVAGAVAVSASLALLPLWRDYVAVVQNAANGSLAYSLGDVPLLAIPLIAWAGRARRDPSGASDL